MGTAAAGIGRHGCALSTLLGAYVRSRPDWNSSYGEDGALIEGFQTPSLITTPSSCVDRFICQPCRHQRHTIERAKGICLSGLKKKMLKINIKRHFLFLPELTECVKQSELPAGTWGFKWSDIQHGVQNLWCTYSDVCVRTMTTTVIS